MLRFSEIQLFCIQYFTNFIVFTNTVWNKYLHKVILCNEHEILFKYIMCVYILYNRRQKNIFEYLISHHPIFFIPLKYWNRLILTITVHPIPVTQVRGWIFFKDLHLVVFYFYSKSITLSIKIHKILNVVNNNVYQNEFYEIS